MRLNLRALIFIQGKKQSKEKKFVQKRLQQSIDNERQQKNVD